MAYVSKELKERLAPEIKAVLKKHKVSGTISIRNYMVLVVKINKVPENFDLIGVRDYIRTELRGYHTCENVNAFYKELSEVMNKENYDRSDVMTDYFDVGYYTEIQLSDKLSDKILEKLQHEKA